MQNLNSYSEGNVFGRLTLTGLTYFEEKYGQNRRMVEAMCECGVVKDYVFDSVKKGDTKSCGCLKTEELKSNPHARTHGLTNHPLFTIWRGMRDRCYYVKHISYQDYGGKGIVVCPEWRNDFKVFYDWAISNGWRNGLSIERRYNDKNYEPTNCTFIFLRRQKSNTTKSVMITAFGETKCVKDWADDTRCKVTYNGLQNRLNRDKKDWPDVEKAITTPPGIRKATVKYKPENRMVLAFGEEKSMSDWLADVRCVVGEKELRKRLNKQWDGEKAMTTPLRKSPTVKQQPG